MLDYSIGEIDSLVLKAYRGAGFSWGMAQEAGAAAGWLSENGYPAIDQFARLLPQIDGCAHADLLPAVVNSSRVPERVCPVVAGCALTDGALCGDGVISIAIESVVSPIILLPFAVRFAATVGQVLLLTHDAQRYHIESGRAVALADHTADSKPATVQIVSSTRQPSMPLPVTSTRGVGDPQSLEVLERFAHRTYVPASDASRLAGAGAGLLDND